jgi:hypothetical protein
MKKQKILLWLGLGIVLFIAAASFLFVEAKKVPESYKKETVIVNMPPSYEVLENDFLAAQELLEGRGRRVKSLTGLPHSKGQYDSLFLTTDRYTMGREQSQELLDWVKKGGHLILTPAAEKAKKDHLFEALKVSLGDSVEGTNFDLRMFGRAGSLRVEFAYEYWNRQKISYRSKDKTKMRTSFYQSLQVVKRPGLIESGPYDGVFYAAFPHGQGRVTLLADAGFMSNHRIHQADHSLIFWTLATQNAKGQETQVFLMRDDQQSLWFWLWNHAKYLVISLGLFFLLWMWSLSRRFGPVKKESGFERRRLMEHIEASAAFYWKSHQAHVLVKSLREAVKHQLNRRRPHWNHISHDELHAHLAELAELSVGEVTAAMTENFHKDTATAKKSITCLELIRRKL